jgi:hypothetical protein
MPLLYETLLKVTSSKGMVHLLNLSYTCLCHSSPWPPCFSTHLCGLNTYIFILHENISPLMLPFSYQNQIGSFSTDKCCTGHPAPLHMRTSLRRGLALLFQQQWQCKGTHLVTWSGHEEHPFHGLGGGAE